MFSGVEKGCIGNEWVNHDFTNHGYLHCAILKALYNLIAKGTHEARDNQFLFLRSSKC